MIDELHENGIKVLLWQIPVLKYSTTAPVQSMRDQFYAEDMGYVFSREGGSTYRMPVRDMVRQQPFGGLHESGSGELVFGKTEIPN